ncbi:hypothetical protein BGZ63DRAFT_15334 [Mariannaea sp. PMI_226]|nr:hypothetical protein BGZ63DRAFT_15334 [Mariannaea sp. PMI_226]
MALPHLVFDGYLVAGVVGMVVGMAVGGDVAPWRLRASSLQRGQLLGSKLRSEKVPLVAEGELQEVPQKTSLPSISAQHPAPSTTSTSIRYLVSLRHPDHHLANAHPSSLVQVQRTQSSSPTSSGQTLLKSCAPLFLPAAPRHFLLFNLRSLLPNASSR